MIPSSASWSVLVGEVGHGRKLIRLCIASPIGKLALENAFMCGVRCTLSTRLHPASKQLQAWRQRQATRHLGHLGLHFGLALRLGVAARRHDQVLQDLRLLRLQEARIDAHAPHLALAVHGDHDQAAARPALDHECRKLLLYFLDAVLHIFDLLHHAHQVVHEISLSLGSRRWAVTISIAPTASSRTAYCPVHPAAVSSSRAPFKRLTAAILASGNASRTAATAGGVSSAAISAASRSRRAA